MPRNLNFDDGNLGRFCKFKNSLYVNFKTNEGIIYI